MRWLFSTFTHGLPLAALLLLRSVTGSALIDRGVMRLLSWPPIDISVLSVAGIGAGLLILAGLWTPVAGTQLATLTLWNFFSQPEDHWISILLGALGAALALLGPRAWSIDAHLLGWKRLDI